MIGGWAIVDSDDVVHRRPNKRSSKVIFVTSLGRPDIYLYVKNPYTCVQPESYGRTSIERSVDGRMFGGSEPRPEARE